MCVKGHFFFFFFTSEPLHSVTCVSLWKLPGSARSFCNQCMVEEGFWLFGRHDKAPASSCYYRLESSFSWGTKGEGGKSELNDEKAMKREQKRDLGWSSRCDERVDRLADGLRTWWWQEDIIERTEGGESGLEDGCSRVQSGEDMTKDQSAGGRVTEGKGQVDRSVR